MSASSLRFAVSATVIALSAAWIYFGFSLVTSHALSTWARGEAFGFMLLGAIALICLFYAWRKPRNWQPAAFPCCTAGFAGVLLVLQYQLNSLVIAQFLLAAGVSVLLYSLVRRSAG